MLSEKRGHVGSGLDRFETHRTLEWQKQCTGETSIEVRQRDQHIRTARPDVKRVALEPVRAAGTRRNCEFLVAMVEVAFKVREIAD